MSRIRPAIIGTVPTLPPGAIVAAGAAEGLVKAGEGLQVLSERVTRTRRVREGAEWDTRAGLKYGEALRTARKAEVDDMEDVITRQRAELLNELSEVDDEVLRTSMTASVERGFLQTMLTVQREKVNREVGLSIAAREEMAVEGQKAIGEGTATAASVLEKVEEYTEAQSPDVFGDNPQPGINKIAFDLIEEEFNVLLQRNPGLAIEYANSDFVRELLDTKQRGSLVKFARGISKGELVAIREQAEDLLNSGDIAALEALVPRIEKHEDSLAKETTLIDVKSKITRFNNQASSAFRAAIAGWTAIANDDPSLFPLSREARNNMWRKARDNGREDVLVGFAARHGLPLPPNAVSGPDSIDAMMSTENPEFALGVRLLRLLPPDRARQFLQSGAVENGVLAETMFDVTAPGRATIPLDRVTEIVTREGAPQALDARAEDILRSPGLLTNDLVRKQNEEMMRTKFNIRPDTEIDDDAIAGFNSFYRLRYADLSTRRPAPVTDATELDIAATRFALNAMSHDWTPAPRPGRGPIMVKAGLYGIGSNAELDVRRSEALLNFFTAVEGETGGAVTPDKPIRIDGETLAPVVSRDIAAEGEDQVLAFAAVNPETGERRVIKKGTKLFRQAMTVVQTGRPLNPLARIKRKTNEPRSLSAADVANPLPSGKTRGEIIHRATMDEWLRLFPFPPNFDDPVQREEFIDLMEDNAADIGFVDGLGLLDETAEGPTSQLPFHTISPRNQVLGIARPSTAVV